MSDFCQINLLKFNSNPKSGDISHQIPMSWVLVTPGIAVESGT
jgi:hypothetical protein